MFVAVTDLVPHYTNLIQVPCMFVAVRRGRLKDDPESNLELSLSKLSILLIKFIVCPYLRDLSFQQNPPYAEKI